MTADFVFQLANGLALLGWIVLGFAIFMRAAFWRDMVAGQIIPLMLSALYTVLILAFWSQAEGGFDSLANVQKLFTYHWAALAGWVHYLAFDLFMGAWISARVMEEGLPRWLLIPLLPTTFLFGPIGYVGFAIARLAFKRVAA